MKIKTDNARYTDPKQCSEMVHWLGVPECAASVYSTSVIKEGFLFTRLFFFFILETQLPYVIM